MKLQVLFTLLTRGALTTALVLLMACPPGLLPQAEAQDHIVSPDALQQQVQRSSAERQHDISTVTAFLSTPTADQAMRSAHIDPVQVRTAIPTLSSHELANLSARAANANQQLAAGFIGPFSLTFIIVAIAVVIILVAIYH
jgi:hypothetical protein